MKSEEELQAILDTYNDSCYPEEFLSGYTIMECLAERNGLCTFLVQDSSEEPFIAKCYDKRVCTLADHHTLLNGLQHKSLPKQTACFENDEMTVTVREYIEGIPLHRYAQDNTLSQQEIVQICVQLCDVLAYLHHRESPIIHRDIKPQNVIVRPDGSIVLIDFDIARVYRSDRDTDTMFFGTLAYAPPEQYGFSQTDARTDIYSLGILLRQLLTGSTKENPNIKIYRPLVRIVRKCTAFSPKERFADVSQVKKALLHANPKSQALRMAAIAVCAVLAVVLLTFTGVKIYQAVTYTPFTDDAIPAYLPDEQRIAEAVTYMKDKYGTTAFDETDNIATVGDLRAAMIDLYGLNRDYVYGINTEMPQESDAFFMPWGWDDVQTVDRDIAVYAAVKVHDPSIVADWSGIRDDNGYYPGARVAMAFAEKTGILTGVNRPGDITLGEMALILANADRVFEAAETK